MVGAQCQRCLVLARRSGGDDRRTVMLGDPDRGLAGRARRGVDQHNLPCGDAAQRLERGQRGGPVRPGPAPAAPSSRGTGIAAAAGSTMYSAKAPFPTPTTQAPAAGRSPPRPLRRSRRRPRNRQVRWPRAVPERAVGLRDVGEVDAGGGDADQDLALTEVGTGASVIRPLSCGPLRKSAAARAWSRMLIGDQPSSRRTERLARRAGRSSHHVDPGHRKRNRSLPNRTGSASVEGEPAAGRATYFSERPRSNACLAQLMAPTAETHATSSCAVSPLGPPQYCTVRIMPTPSLMPRPAARGSDTHRRREIAVAAFRAPVAHI